MNDQCLVIFAKAPVPGQVKTRLLPVLTEIEAARLHQTMLRYLVATHSVVTDYDLILYCAPDTIDPFFQLLKEAYGLRLEIQQGADLGERMYTAINQELGHYNKVALIGSDAPVIDPIYIRQVFSLLDTKQIVFGPAEDGGYVLVAATQVQPEWFQQIAWGTADVMVQTQLKISAQQMVLTQQLWDVDEPADLERLRSSGLYARIMAITGDD